MFDRTEIRWLIVFEGVNDIVTAAPAKSGQQNAVDALIAACLRIGRRAQSQRVEVLGATLTPFGGHNNYDGTCGLREASRQAINQWIRSGWGLGAILDFDHAVRDPASPRRLLPPFDCGEHLHLSPAGYRALADAVPVGMFRAP